MSRLSTTRQLSFSYLVLRPPWRGGVIALPKLSLGSIVSLLTMPSRAATLSLGESQIYTQPYPFSQDSRDKYSFTNVQLGGAVSLTVEDRWGVTEKSLGDPKGWEVLPQHGWQIPHGLTKSRVIRKELPTSGWEVQAWRSYLSGKWVLMTLLIPSFHELTSTINKPILGAAFK